MEEDNELDDGQLHCPECGSILEVVLFQCKCELYNCLQSICQCRHCKIPGDCNKECLRDKL